MSSLTRFNIRFTPRWQMCAITLITLLVFTRLGFWQLQRADEKKQMLLAHHTLRKQSPILWKTTDALPAQYQQIQLQGRFLPQTLLLDNQHHQHQFGYHVIAPLVLANGHVLLIDQGWLSGDVTRRRLPKIEVQTGLISLRGSAYYPSENWHLGQVFEKEHANLVVIELLDTKLIGQFLHKSVYPFIIRLDKDDKSIGYVREWPTVAMPPERHYAYAVQWFAMALVVFIMFIALNMKKKT